MKQKMFEAALKARENAYAPYSKYTVGSAVVSPIGEVFSGCNVENLVYPLGQCAERVAIQNLVASGETRFEALILVTENGTTPCGACRQVMAEFGAPKVVVYIASTKEIIRETTVGELLPDQFSPE
jgi:cytidine deaminase